MPAPAKGGRRRSRRALTEEEILDAALKLLDEGGPNAASVRGIAARVGVAPNAVYTYFPDKASVIKALGERLLGEVLQDSLDHSDDPWQACIEALALNLRARLAAHPGAITLMIGGPLDGPHALALQERLLQLLADAGVPASDAARGAHLLIVYVFGSIAVEVTERGQPGPPAKDTDRLPSPRRTLSDAQAQQFPRSAAATTVIGSHASTEQYLWGLHRLLDAITATTAATPASETP
jgi:TetR/AcrR family transcriptional regulator, tetracycline repressor protein